MGAAHAEAARVTSSSSPWKVVSSWSSHGAGWPVELCPPQTNIIPQKGNAFFLVPCGYIKYHPTDLKLSKTLWGSWAWKPFSVPCLLFVGNRLQSP